MKNTMKIIPLALVLAASPALAAEKSAGTHVDDSWLHTKVKSALVGEGASTINVEVHKGVVQLAGFVKSDEARDRAINEAGAVKDVVRVSNALVVQTKTRTPGRLLDDGVLAGRVKKALADSDRTRSFQINVEANHGVVLLSGFVGSESHKNAAGEVAAAAKGSGEVINRIEVVN